MEMTWPEFSDLVCALTSTKDDGDLSFKWGSAAETIIENRKKFFRKNNLKLDSLIMADQPHGQKVLPIDQKSMGRGAYQQDWIVGVDGFVTSDNSVILGIETADCLPIFLFDPINKIIGLAHAGWRGVISNIAQSLVATAMKLNCSKENILIHIGPHIKSCCFEVQSDLVKIFSAQYPEFITISQGGAFIDLAQVVKKQLLSAGISEKNITVSTACTCCQPNKYYSFRRDKNDSEGSMLSIIKLL